MTARRRNSDDIFNVKYVREKLKKPQNFKNVSLSVKSHVQHHSFFEHSPSEL